MGSGSHKHKYPRAATAIYGLQWAPVLVFGKRVERVDVVNAENLAGQKLAAAFTHKDIERMSALEDDKVALTQMRAE